MCFRQLKFIVALCMSINDWKSFDFRVTHFSEYVGVFANIDSTNNVDHAYIFFIPAWSTLSFLFYLLTFYSLFKFHLNRRPVSEIFPSSETELACPSVLIEWFHITFYIFITFITFYVNIFQDSLGSELLKNRDPFSFISVSLVLNIGSFT